MRTIVVACAVSSFALAGCGSSSCEDAVTNAMKLYGYGGASYGGMHANAIKSCKDEKWSEQVRNCVAGAKSRRDVDGCEKLLRPAAAAAEERSRPSGPIEAYEDYMKKGKQSEAELNLHALSKSLKAHYVEQAAFPTGAVPLTPAAPCCEGPNHKCPPNASDWNGNPVWDALDFGVFDPGYFQYSYESADGQTAVATAVGDLDCDTTTATYELRCEARDGTPSCTITKPPRPD